MSEKYINTLRLSNFRCYKDETVGPFGKFNLIFGRNASGKTSLFEALELGFTGSSSKLQIYDDLREILPLNSRRGITIYINGRETFNSSDKSIDYVAKLYDYFGITVDDGKSAKSITSNIFLTSNLLYSERIIQFLEVSNKESLTKVIKESLISGDLLLIWERICEARSLLQKETKLFQHYSDSYGIAGTYENHKNGSKVVSPMKHSRSIFLSEFESLASHMRDTIHNLQLSDYQKRRSEPHKPYRHEFYQIVRESNLLSTYKDEIMSSMAPYVNNSILTEKSYKERDHRSSEGRNFEFLLRHSLSSDNKEFPFRELVYRFAEDTLDIEELETFKRDLSEYYNCIVNLVLKLRFLNSFDETIVQDLQSSLEYYERIMKLKSIDDFIFDIWKNHERTISNIFKKLQSPMNFSDVSFKKKNNIIELMVSELNSKKQVPAHGRLSSGQRAALAISVFLTLNASSSNIPPILLMDEPIQNVDDVNVLNFLDLLRWYIKATNRQIFITTSNTKLRSLIRKKFSFLGNDFLELNLLRNAKTTRIEYYDHKEDRIKH